ncbi:hypothetical protein [Microcoleus sp. herbarium2]|uniref:hypothetical protein n=1 Tax=Microcoleus sp. herbarium2 TaxID=3055433 RepID=UPI002FD0522E
MIVTNGKNAVNLNPDRGLKLHSRVYCAIIWVLYKKFRLHSNTIVTEETAMPFPYPKIIVALAMAKSHRLHQQM